MNTEKLFSLLTLFVILAAAFASIFYLSYSMLH